MARRFPQVLRTFLSIALLLCMSLAGAATARAQLPFAVAMPGVAAVAAPSLEETYGSFKQRWERNNLVIKEQVEAASREARQALQEFTLSSRSDFDQALLALGDWATGAGREGGAPSAGPVGELQQKLELGQTSLRDLSRQFKAFQSEVNRNTRTLPKDVRDRFQAEARAVERSIDAAVLSLDGLLSDARTSVDNSSGALQARLQEDLKGVVGALEESSRMVEAFFTPA
jgi:hypothetical protein